MLAMRQRGKAEIWYIRGTVKYGRKTILVPEFSTGTSDEHVATLLKGEHERELMEQLIFGPAASIVHASIADAFDAYLCKPIRPHGSDVVRIGRMNEHIGGLSLADPLAAWHQYREQQLLKHAPSGQDRYRSLLQSSINTYRAKLGLAAIRLPAIKFSNQRFRFLDRVDRDRLLASYAPHVRPIMTLLAFQGARTQEALQLQWGASGVDLERGTIFFGRTKNGDPRSVAIHPRVEAQLLVIWQARGRPTTDHVFLNRVGRPYTDTRDLPVPGGNPLWRSHRSACGRAGIKDFRVHDWRHHWASHCVMCGIDLLTVMRLGGWKSLRMVQRYAAIDTAHMRRAILRLR